MKAFLRIISGPLAGREIDLGGRDRVVVGRSPQATLSMPDDRLLSREHFCIQFSPPRCILKDLGSTNGTKLNGRWIESTPLRHGDVIAAGKSMFVVDDNESGGDERRALRCVGCDRVAPDPRECHGVAPDASGYDGGVQDACDSAFVTQHGQPPSSWLCDDCAKRRRQFPATHPDYLIERRLGAGGMGEVYLARQLSSRRQVAIKMSFPTGETSDRAREYFRREMNVLRGLVLPNGQCHPNIVAFHDTFEVNGQFQLIMEYVPGKNALEWAYCLSTPVPVLAAAQIGWQLLLALEYVHFKGYVHRDVKPSNLLIMGQPRWPQVKLTDFGLAKNIRESGIHSLTNVSDIGGSVGFLSPEHIRGFRDLQESADIYCAGATLYYLLTQRYPYFDFDPRRGDAFGMILESPPVPLRVHRPDAPEGLERVLRKAMEKQPQDRWQSAASMAEALHPFLECSG